MITVKNLSVDLNKKNIINNLSMNIKKSEFVSIIGPNGCGKSTLIKTIAGINKQSRGDILINGIKKEYISRKDLAKKVSFLMQFNNTSKDMNVKEIVCFGRHPYIKPFKTLTRKDYEIINWAIEKTYINDLLDKNIESISGGEKQRVFLAMALAQQTEILILDEPTNHLDIKYQYDLLNLIKKLNKNNNLTVICVLHDINQALKFSDRIFVMDSGKIVKQGKPVECISPHLIKNVYGINCNICYRNENYYLDVL